MDSLAWSRKYDVLHISRLQLHSLGFSSEQIQRLSDADMQAIADALFEVCASGFAENVRFLTTLHLAERSMYGSQESLCQDRDA